MCLNNIDFYIIYFLYNICKIFYFKNFYILKKDIINVNKFMEINMSKLRVKRKKIYIFFYWGFRFFIFVFKIIIEYYDLRYLFLICVLE